MDELHKTVDLVHRVLGAEAIGVYLHGSSVAGGLRPASDVDILVVTEKALDETQRRALLDGLLAISGSRNNARPVELTVVTQSAVRPWRYPPVADFLYGEWLRSDYESGVVPQPETTPDLALLITMTLAGNRPLSGPPPAEVLAPVPFSDVVSASTAGMPDLLDDVEDDTRNVLLTLARIWCTLATGEIASKDHAAAWALDLLPPEHRPALAHARQLYLHTSYADEHWSDELKGRVHPLADRLVAEITHLRDHE